jgi:hypothetical protein
MTTTDKKQVQHTPGPWRVNLTHPKRYSDVRYTHVVETAYNRSPYFPAQISPSNGGEEALANAHLIASAPELLAACKAIHKWIINRPFHAICQFEEAGDIACPINTLLEAIAKAEGRC